MIKKAGYIWLIVCLLAINTMSLIKPDQALSALALSGDGQQYAEKALKWLKAQQDEYPLIRSKYIPDDDPYGRKNGLDRRSWIYDNALSAIAFTMADEKNRARRILDTLALLQNNSQDKYKGSLYFSYDIENGPIAGVNEVYSGALAWVGYAAVFYDKTYQENRYVDFAKGIADFLLTLQADSMVKDPYGQVYFGGVSGGYDYTGKKLNWYSTEHNIDCYFFFRDLGELTGQQKYAEAARLIRHALVTYHWDNEKQYFKGDSGQNLTLDSNSWGGIFAQAIYRQDMVQGAAHFVQKFEVNHQKMSLRSDTRAYNMTYTANASLSGFKPYLPGGEHKIKLDEVWAEGTWGVINEMLRRGVNADKYIQSMFAMQDADPRGGLVTSNTGAGEFHVWPDVASTAWAYITLTDPKVIWKPDSMVIDQALPNQLKRINRFLFQIPIWLPPNISWSVLGLDGI